MKRKDQIRAAIAQAKNNCTEEIKKVGRRTIRCHSWDDLLIVVTYLQVEGFGEIDLRYRKKGKRIFVG